MTEKNFELENFFKPLGVGDLWVPSVLDFAGEYPLILAVHMAVSMVISIWNKC